MKKHANAADNWIRSLLQGVLPNGQDHNTAE
jgi:hypothetical protein